MAITLTNAGARITATAAATATAMASGTTTAEAQALGALLTVLGQRPDLAQPPTSLVAPTLGVSIVSPG
jgi:hypothetical protein